MNETAESYIGDLLEQRELIFDRTIEVRDLDVPLARILARLEIVAPPHSTVFRIHLVEEPYPDAHTYPAGRIFITRKAVLLAKSEDELAGVIAHEMGHVLTRQLARDYEELLRNVLDIKTLGSKDDVEERFHQLYEKVATRPERTLDTLEKLANRRDKEQLEADQVSIALLYQAGYNPEALANYFDRLTENKGKTGSAWSEFFHTTKPEAKRFREMLKSVSVLSNSCRDQKGRMTPEEFAAWHASLLAFSGFGKVDAVPGGQIHELKEPLRSDITLLRFSPDGNYILAQDPESVYVLSRQPFQTLFRFDAEGAHPAQFTPDSQNIVLVTDASRIEKWGISERAELEAVEPHIPRPCAQEIVSPTGQYLACVQANERGEFPWQLALIDIESGQTIWIQKGVVKESTFIFGSYLFHNAMGHKIDLGFSPDGHYLAGSGDNGPFVYDLEKKSALPLTSQLKKLLQSSIFLAGDRILSYPENEHEKVSIATFPGGQVLSQLPLGQARAARTTNPGVFVVRPFPNASAALVEVPTGRVFFASKNAPIDTREGEIVTEEANGEIALYGGANRALLAKTALTKGPVTRFQTVALAPDGKYIAYSDHSRGGVWKLSDGSRRGLFRGFTGSYIDNNQFVAIFPSEDAYNPTKAFTKEEAKEIGTRDWKMQEVQKPGLFIAAIDLNSSQGHVVRKFTKQFSVWQHGRFAVIRQRFDDKGESSKSLDYEFDDLASGTKLWNRSFDRSESLSLFFNPVGSTVIFVWNADEKDGQALLKDNKALSETVHGFPKGTNGAVLLDVVDEATGQRRFTVPIDTGSGSFSIKDVDVVGDTLVYADNYDRLVIYDSSGKRLGRIFGRRAALDPTGRLLITQAEPGRLVAYSLPELKKIQTYTFSARVAYTGFTSDSKQLMVITADQTIWSINVSSAAVTAIQ
ncbi:MAG TPA: M48 family metallopeptidase [Terriglobales bacterium]|nr:M48 family metallopeptidase [Terriglobales bacterium]